MGFLQIISYTDDYLVSPLKVWVSDLVLFVSFNKWFSITQ